jgi:hypothetical protein
LLEDSAMKTLATCSCLSARPERRVLHFEIARHAARLERERDRWTQRYLELLETTVFVPHVDASAALDAIASDLAVRLAPVVYGADRDGYPGVELLGAQLAAHIRAGKRVMVDLSGIAPRERARDPCAWDVLDLTTVARRLAHATGVHGVRYAPAGYSIRADHPDLYWFLHEFVPRLSETATCVIVIDDGLMEAIDAAARCLPLTHPLTPRRDLIDTGTAYQCDPQGVYGERDAREGWACVDRAVAAHPNLHIALRTGGLANPLATLERCDTVVPGFGLLMPANAAHLPLVVDLRVLVLGTHGDTTRIESAIAATVRLANRLFDQIAWPSDAVRIDAICHRRLAIRLAGIGDVVTRLHLDPSRPQTVSFARHLVHTARRAALRASAADALARGACKALRPARIAGSPLARRSLEAASAQRARAGLRNAQLIALSPFDFVPHQGGFTPRDLAPLLAALSEADVIAALPLRCKQRPPIPVAGLWLETWRALKAAPGSRSLHAVPGGAAMVRTRT